tara:strand:+ start:26725 stop:27030 length:306 start_codon:yes stop_codon:yes gene_type:complete
MKGLKRPKGQLLIMDGQKEGSTWDNFFGKIGDYITGSIQRFVAFLFFIITIGAVFGYFVGSRTDISELVLIIPAIAGLLAYNNRAFAIAGFVLFLILIFLL